MQTGCAYETASFGLESHRNGMYVSFPNICDISCPETKDGTAMRRALIQLGYIETYHGFNPAFESPRDCEMWLDAFRAKYDRQGKPFGRAEFDKLLGHCQAVTDMPA